MRTRSLTHHASPHIIRLCLDGQAGGFSTREVFGGIPEFATSYKTCNSLGTALGDGVRGRGLGLHRDRSGRFLRCRDNAALAAAALGDAEFEALARELGYDGPDELGDAIDRLPPAEGAPTP
jgi:hypothetical protein